MVRLSDLLEFMIAVLQSVLLAEMSTDRVFLTMRQPAMTPLLALRMMFEFMFLLLSAAMPTEIMEGSVPRVMVPVSAALAELFEPMAMARSEDAAFVEFAPFDAVEEGTVIKFFMISMVIMVMVLTMFLRRLNSSECRLGRGPPGCPGRRDREVRGCGFRGGIGVLEMNALDTLIFPDGGFWLWSPLSLPHFIQSKRMCGWFKIICV